jgi:hypothetical protein
MDMPQCEYCKHEIRNAIVSYKGLKYRVLKDLIQVVRNLNAMDEQHRRVELVLEMGPVRRKRTIIERIWSWLAHFATKLKG